MKLPKLTKLVASAIITASFVLVPQGVVLAYKSAQHIFNVDDVMRGYDGSTFGPSGTIQRYNTFCDLWVGNLCPPETQPWQDEDGVWLYPVDSEFGYYTVDLLGAQEKTMDLIYTEGFAGDILDGGATVGLKIVNANADFYKAKPPMGTWCRGAIGDYVKCESEHYTVMEHSLSCHEVIPYKHADPLTGAQALLSLPDGSASFDCINAALDDVLNVVSGGVDTGSRLTDATPGVQIDPNNNTSVQDDLAVSSDYSLRLKDDGTPVYRWGSAVKMSNDVRLYVKIPLPPEWKVPGADFPVSSAKLVIEHDVTDNADDLIRPEDLENYGAMGRVPSYSVEASGTPDENWKSRVSCYEGDGDLIGTEGIGTFLRNKPFIVDGTDPAEPLPFSEDLKMAFTNAWYASLDRDPFEWAYDGNSDPNIQDFVGSPLPNPTLGILASGPQWKLKSNKFSLDLAGVEIPKINCTLPSSRDDDVKYKTGTRTTTVINLLDWDVAEMGSPSPLATSKGWVDVTQNPFVVVGAVVNGIPVTTNGLPMTDDFDLGIHVREELKPTALYSVQLYINEEPIVVSDGDVDIAEFKVPIRPPAGSTKRVTVAITNTGTATIPSVDIVVSNDIQGVVYSASYPNLAAGELKTFAFRWTVPTEDVTVNWLAKTLVDGVEVDQVTAITQVR